MQESLKDYMSKLLVDDINWIEEQLGKHNTELNYIRLLANLETLSLIYQQFTNKCIELKSKEEPVSDTKLNMITTDLMKNQVNIGDLIKFKDKFGEYVEVVDVIKGGTNVEYGEIEAGGYDILLDENLTCTLLDDNNTSAEVVAIYKYNGKDYVLYAEK